MYDGSRIPGVSNKYIFVGLSQTLMRSKTDRVTPGRSPLIVARPPLLRYTFRSLLMTVDLPTLGMPMMSMFMLLSDKSVNDVSCSGLFDPDDAFTIAERSFSKNKHFYQTNSTWNLEAYFIIVSSINIFRTHRTQIDYIAYIDTVRSHFIEQFFFDLFFVSIFQQICFVQYQYDRFDWRKSTY